MKNRETKQKDLKALTERFQNSNSALVIGFNKLTVAKDQELRNKLREIGAKYQVVKNTIATKAVEGTPFAGAAEHFKGMTAIATHESDAVTLSKTLTKFVKDNETIYSFKVGVVEGKVFDLNAIQEIANLPSREELISKIMFLINCQAQRLVTVINAVPRNLAVVIKQIGEQKGEQK
jgi:large subunit ribosomal protein L10